MINSSYQPIFQLTRGDIVESVHYGAIAVVEASGRLAAWFGDPGLVTFTRSSAKPLQALPFLENGGMAHYGLTLQEVALLCASHSGTDTHLAVIQSIQAKTGVRESDLMCGTHTVYDRKTAEAMQQRGEIPTPNRHNCSGKHTGMLAFSLMLGLTIDPEHSPYIDPDHPVQRRILIALAEMSDLMASDIHIGLDGCSAPNFALPLRGTALAFARLCQSDGLPEKRAETCRLISKAMLTNPDMIGGPDNFDTNLMNAAQGRVICKGGAEGFQAFGVMPGAIKPGSPGMGVAFKVSDGDLKGHNFPYGDPRGHVRPAVTLEILRQLGVFETQDLEKLAEFGPGFPVENWRKLRAGWASPCFTLDKAQ
ncbi:MAG TPA: asparaginase [Anaerolineales bacterium]|nr:asparaginase [Anaerolineales bacterium]